MFSVSAGSFIAFLLSLCVGGSSRGRTLKRLLEIFVIAAFPALSITALAQYRIDTWTTESGLPQNSINRVVQTRDGYIWLATSDGLARFDGVRFKVFNKANSDGLETNRIAQIHEDGSGRLWVSGEDGSLLFYEHGKFTVIGGADDKRYNPRTFLADDGEGGVIFSLFLFPGAQHFQFRNGTFVPWERQGMPDGAAIINRDREGGFWFYKGNDYFRLINGELKTFTIEGGGYRNVYEDRAGNFWLAIDLPTNRIHRIKNGQIQVFDTPINRHVGLTEDKAGNLWLYTYDNGILRLDAGNVNSDDLTAESFRLFTVEDGLLSNSCRVMTADREGGVWAGSEKGLHRLSPQIVRVFSKKDGLQEDNIYPILEDRSGVIWLGAWQQSLIRYDWNGFSTFLNRDDLAFYSALFEDRDGRLWFGNANLFYIENGKPVQFVVETGLKKLTLVFNVISQDTDGAMWFGSSQGLSRYVDGRSTVYTTDNGLPNNVISAFLQVKDGRIWVGTRDGVGIGEKNSEGEWTWKAITEKDGLASNYTRSLYEDTDGTIWIGSYDGGLTRYKDGKCTPYSMKDGLSSNGVFCILEDDGWFWMNSNQGIFRVRKQELNDFADGKTKFLTSIAYGKQDGLLNIEGNGGRQPAGIKAKDGTLWFPMAQGVAVVDPKNIATNPIPPPVLIEDALIERKPVENDIFQKAIGDPGAEIQLDPGQNNLEIQYTGLSFVNSDQVKFKYRLEGAETEWSDVGTRRSAYYSYLPPGSYTFHVLAANRDGVWNDKGAMVRILVNPAFYQTIWFWALCAFGVFLIITLVYRYRLAQLEKINEARTAFTQQLIENQENERKRIAVELHDSIGQSLIVIRNRALMSLGKPDKHEWMAEQMEEISEAAADSISEVRQIAHNLHPYQLEHLGLTTALETMIETADKSSSIDFSTFIDDVDDTLSKDGEISLYRIVQESVNNILKHSEATSASITLVKNDAHLHLSIEDNGKGFTPEQAERKHGLGLTGQRERANMLHAEYKISSVEGKGTTVTLDMIVDKPRNSVENSED